jgi:hypothetical protein
MKRTIVTFAALALVSLLAACSASSTTGTPTPTSAPTATPTIAPTATPTPPPAAVDLSGTWSGQYSGVYTGTFVLTWTQSVSSLTGHIVLSSPARTLGITGNVAGSAINFGAVGAVTYTGTISGSTMSGTYTVLGSATGGSWNANKTS